MVSVLYKKKKNGGEGRGCFDREKQDCRKTLQAITMKIDFSPIPTNFPECLFYNKSFFCRWNITVQ